MLAIARVMGETAPLLVTTGVITSANWNPFEGRMMNLAVFAYNSTRRPASRPSRTSTRAWAAALTLIIIVLVLYFVARLVYAALGQNGDPEIVNTEARTEPRDEGGRLRAMDGELRRIDRGHGPKPLLRRVPRREGVNMTIQREQGDCADRRIRLREVDLPALAEPHARARSRCAREGHVRLEGEDIYAPAIDPVSVRRRIGMVFQAPNPFPTMSIYDNVAAGLKLNTRRVKKSDLDAVVERSLKGPISGKR